MIINGYEFWKSFRVAMYMSGGARRCSVQSPPTVYARHCQYLSAVAVNICRLSLSKFDTVTTVNICRCRQAVGAVNAVNAVMAFKLLQLLPLPLPLPLPLSCVVVIVVVVPLSLSLSLNVNIQKLKNVPHVPRGTITVHKKQNLKIVLRGTSAMQLLRVQVGVQT